MKTAMLPLRAGEFVGMCAKASWSHLRLTWLYTLAGDHPPDTFTAGLSLYEGKGI